jgi:hypothetical protein
MRPRLFRGVWTALITVVLTASVAIYGAVKAWKSHREAVRNSLHFHFKNGVGTGERQPAEDS